MNDFLGLQLSSNGRRREFKKPRHNVLLARILWTRLKLHTRQSFGTLLWSTGTFLLIYIFNSVTNSYLGCRRTKIAHY